MNDQILAQFASINRLLIAANYALAVSATKFRAGMLVLGSMVFGASLLALIMLVLSLI